MAMIGGLSRPTHGIVMLEDTDIWALPDNGLADFRNREIGFVFQFASLLPTLRVIDNVALPALLGRRKDSAAAYGAAADLLGQLGLAEQVEDYPAEISAGEQRRAVIARALINGPSLLLADEPTSDLDEQTEIEIMDRLRELNRSRRDPDHGDAQPASGRAGRPRAPHCGRQPRVMISTEHLPDIANLSPAEKDGLIRELWSGFKANAFDWLGSKTRPVPKTSPARPPRELRQRGTKNADRCPRMSRSGWATGLACCGPVS
jgi:hypothetical protein